MPYPVKQAQRSRTDTDDIATRFAKSAVAHDTSVMSTTQFHAWFAEHTRTNRCQATPAPLDQLDGWLTNQETGDLEHRSGRFYTIAGLDVVTEDQQSKSWSQPIIVQAEIGILGILVKEIDGVLHFLMQAKVEPGNINGLQLSPTIQATRSNYTRVHQGSAIPYLEYFDAPQTGRTLVHSLQSEQGASFLNKRNRNMIVEVTEDLPALTGFCWLTLAQLHELLRIKNLVHMDARSVMSVMPPAAWAHALPALSEDSFRGAIARSLTAPEGLANGTDDLMSWFTRIKAQRSLSRRLIPLNQVKSWNRTPDRIFHEEGKYFSVLGVDVEASYREVQRWSQPLIAPICQGIVAFLTKQIDGVLYVLVQARTEAGTFDVVELGPSVQCVPGNHPGSKPRFLDYALAAGPAQIRFDAVHSEEGGRFYHAENRYLIIEADDDFPTEAPEGYAWATVGELTQLVQHGLYINIEARCLLACLHSLA